MARPPVPAEPMMQGDMPPEGEPTAESTVVATICRRPDGTYEVYAGDEPEPAEEGAAPMEREPAQSYDTVGAVLKATMDILRGDQANGPEGSPEDNFRAGFEAA